MSYSNLVFTLTTNLNVRTTKTVTYCYSSMFIRLCYPPITIATHLLTRILYYNSSLLPAYYIVTRLCYPPITLLLVYVTRLLHCYSSMLYSPITLLLVYVPQAVVAQRVFHHCLVIVGVRLSASLPLFRYLISTGSLFFKLILLIPAFSVRRNSFVCRNSVDRRYSVDQDLVDLMLTTGSDELAIVVVVSVLVVDDVSFHPLRIHGCRLVLVAVSTWSAGTSCHVHIPGLIRVHADRNPLTTAFDFYRVWFLELSVGAFVVFDRIITRMRHLAGACQGRMRRFRHGFQARRSSLSGGGFPRNRGRTSPVFSSISTVATCSNRFYFAPASSPACSKRCVLIAVSSRSSISCSRRGALSCCCCAFERLLSIRSQMFPSW